MKDDFPADPVKQSELTGVAPAFPLITFVIAMFNSAITVRQCLDSVVQQTCKNFEVVVIDGGSTDGSIDILRNREEHIAYWKSEPDRGVYDAWNKALMHARGEWVCFLGSDDYLSNRTVVQQLSMKLKELSSDVSIAYGKIALLDRNDEVMFEFGDPWQVIELPFKKKMCLPHPAVMHRRTLFNNCGIFDTDFRIAGDYEFLLRATKRHTPYFLGDIVVTAMRPGGLSSNSADSLRALREVYRAQSQNGQTGLALHHVYAFVRLYVRLLFVKCLGERVAAKMLDWGRARLGLPAYWTKI